MKNFLKTLKLAILTSFMACSSDPEKPVVTYPVEPPFPAISLASNRFEMEATEAKVLRTTNGSSIMVPENAFVDENGNPVQGKVSLEYKEFHSAADILASGIPMDVTDQNGQTQHLESGGMFELNATSNGRTVGIASDKKLKVNLSSSVKGQDFDFYYLEEKEPKQAAGTFIPEVKASKDKPKQYAWKKLYSPSDSIEKSSTKFEKDPNATYFQLHFDTKKYPETAALDTIQWEYAAGKDEKPTAASITESIKDEQWAGLTLSKPKYKVKLQKEFRSKTEESRVHIFSDSSGYILFNKEQKNGQWYDWNGMVKAIYNNIPVSLEEHLYIRASKNCRYIYFYTYAGDHSELKVYTKQGKLIYEDKDIHTQYSIHFMKNEDRLVMLNKANQYKIINLKTGKVQAVIPEEINSYDQRDEMEAVLIRNGNLLSMYNEDGKRIVEIKLEEGFYSSVSDANNLDYVIIQTYDRSNTISSMKVWDWKNNKLYDSKIPLGNLLYKYLDEDGQEGYYHSQNCDIHPSEPIVIAYEKDIPVIWNFKENTFVKLSNYRNFSFDFSRKGNFIEGNSNSTSVEENKKNRKCVLLSKTGKLLQEVANSNHSIELSNDEKTVLTYSGNEISLKETSGRLIRKLTDYDSSITWSFFTGQNTVFAFSMNGNVYHWDTHGKLINSTSLNVKGYFFPADSRGDLFYSLGSAEDKLSVYNFKGELLYTFNNGMRFLWEGARILDFSREGMLVYPHPNVFRHWKKTDELLGPDDYLLNVKKENNDFSVYVRLSPSQKKLVDEYSKILKGRLKLETKRAEEEEKLVRSFEINKFGIYNWDRFYKDSTSLLVNASFDFDTVGTAFSNLTVFLITGQNRTAVIKYPKDAWTKFSFNPEEPNLLIVVLLGNKIGIMKEEEFRSLDLAKIKKDKAYTFKLTVLDGPASQEALNELLRHPPS